MFWRVADSRSRACFVEGEGILAEDACARVGFEDGGAALRRHLARHLDWSNTRATPFVSVYSDEETAWWEAERRAGAGKRDVVVYKIDVDCSCESVEYRNVRRLAGNLGLEIEEKARNNSRHEWIFLHHVPDGAVVGVAELEGLRRGRGRRR